MYLAATGIRTPKRPPYSESLYGLLYPGPLYGYLYSAMLSVRRYNAVFTVDDGTINFFFLAVEPVQIYTIQRYAVSVSSIFLRPNLFCWGPSEPLFCTVSVPFALTLPTSHFVRARARAHTHTHAHNIYVFPVIH